MHALYSAHHQIALGGLGLHSKCRCAHGHRKAEAPHLKVLSQKFPCEDDRLLPPVSASSRAYAAPPVVRAREGVLSAPAEREIPEHLEEGVMPRCEADIVEIVMFAADAQALLGGSRA